MDKLPNEILKKIFILLPITQKQECLFVCKKWKHVILAQSLFQKLYINLSSGQFKCFIRLVKKYPELALQVQELTFFKEKYPDYDLIHFFHQLPNLQVINNFNIPRIDEDAENQILNIGGNHRWKYFSGFASVSLMKWALKYPSTLVSITLSNYFRTDILSNDIIPLFKNAPLLNHLCLGNNDITVRQCEAMHRNAPALKSLGIRLLALLSFYDTGITISEPANNLKTLTLNNHCANLETFVEWNHYINKKYPNLENYNHNLFFNIVDISFRFPCHMKSYQMIIKQSLRLLDLSCLGGIDHFKSLLSLLDICHIQTIRLYHAEKYFVELLSESNQSENIERLEFYSLNRNVQLGKWTKKMKSLKSLKYRYEIIHHKDFDTWLATALNRNITDILSSPPNEINLKYDIFPTIEELCLDYYSDWLPSFVAFVGVSLPNLHKLKLHVDNRGRVDWCTISLEFLRHQFTLLDVSGSCTYPKPNVEVVTKGKSRYFVEKKSCRDYSLLEKGWMQVSKNCISHIYLTVMCDSIEKFYFNSKLVL